MKSARFHADFMGNRKTHLQGIVTLCFGFLSLHVTEEFVYIIVNTMRGCNKKLFRIMCSLLDQYDECSSTKGNYKS